MIAIHIDGREAQADPAHNLLEACLSLKLDLPYFCWHPALGSVGACRQCAVKSFHGDKDEHGRIVMACLTAVTPGLRISIEDVEARKFRAAVIEGMMLNHPHDCPVCDVGGECHLQDMTVMTGHDYRRTRFPKRTFRNQDLGPFVAHEMNRCIQCYRCARYYNDYAGGRDFGAFRLRDLVYFGRSADGTLESEFAGNLVEVCPTGVFTDKTLAKHYTRKWDLQMAPSVCVHCSLGCNTTVGERYGKVRRIVNRYHGEVNHYFLCDRGRYGYEFVNDTQRLRQPLSRRDGVGRALNAELALEKMLEWLSGSARVIGIGSPRASLESNFALRQLVGAAHFHAGFSDDEHRLVSAMLGILKTSPARTPSLREIERSDAVLVLGEDVSNTAPRIALALRQSVLRAPLERAAEAGIPAWHDQAVREIAQDERSPLFVATAEATRLDDIATSVYRASPDDIARLGFAVAHAIDQEMPSVSDLHHDVAATAERIAAALRSAKRPLVIAGSGCNSLRVIEAAANIAGALHRVGVAAELAFVVPECNTLGVAMLDGETLRAAFDAVRVGEADTVIVLENDLYRRAPAGDVDAFLSKARRVIVIDHLPTPTTTRAHLVLPAATFAESDGTFVNNEGRAQRFFQAFVATDMVRESWRWLTDAMALTARFDGPVWTCLDDVIAAMCSLIPSLRGVRDAAPPAGFRIAGAKVAREPERYSGRTAMNANLTIREPRPPTDADSALAFSMEGARTQPPASLLPFAHSPGWNSVQAFNKLQREIAGPLAGGDPGVRLLEPAATSKAAPFTSIPLAFEQRANAWLFIPIHHVFGSEELSLHAGGVAELAPRPYVLVNREDAKELGIVAGEAALVTFGATQQRLPVVLSASLPHGVAGLPIGLRPRSHVSLPAWGHLERTS